MVSNGKPLGNVPTAELIQRGVEGGDPAERERIRAELQRRPRRVWSYGSRGWRRVRCPLPVGELDKGLRQQGYSMVSRYGPADRDGYPWGLVLELWEGDGEKFAVMVSTPFSVWPVLVRGLPNMLRLLRRELPTIESATRCEQMGRKWRGE